MTARWSLAALSVLPILVACGSDSETDEASDPNTWAASERSEQLTGVHTWEVNEPEQGVIDLYGRDGATTRVHARFTMKAEQVIVDVDAPSAWRFETYPGMPASPAPMPQDVAVALAASASDIPAGAVPAGSLTAKTVSPLRVRVGALVPQELLDGDRQPLVDPDGHVQLLCDRGLYPRLLLREQVATYLQGIYNYMNSHPACQDPTGGVWDPGTDPERAAECMDALRSPGGCANPQHLYDRLLDNASGNDPVVRR